MAVITFPPLSLIHSSLLGFKERPAGPSSSSFSLRRSDSLMSEASGNDSLTQT